MIWRRWKYRVRDCKTRMVGHYDTLEEVVELFGPDPWLIGLLEGGCSISDGQRYKIDVRGKYCDNRWEM